LIKAVADGILPITEGFVEEMNFCLDCQACETACPAGVKYGSLVEAARTQIYEKGYEKKLSSILKSVFLVWSFKRHTRLKIIARFLRFYQMTGLKDALQRSGLLGLVSKKLDGLQPLTPKIAMEFSSDILPTLLEPKEELRFRVGFLTGCIMDVAYSDINIDTVELLRRAGCQIVLPERQGCCGSLQAHHGGMRAAREMARENILSFGKQSLDYIVMNSAGCGAFMKEYGHLFEQDQEISSLAASISAKTKDVTEFLTQIGFDQYLSKSSFDHPYVGKRVTYHDACHLVHTQKVASPPRKLLRSIRGIDFIELPESSWCCGSAGIYNITRYEDSMRLLDRKIDNVQKIAPDVIVTGNPGCLMQIQHGLNKRELHIELVHTATFLRRVCGA
jgi:glycolate oxidase iron-sulfur subunit